MTKKLQHIFALSEKGAKDLVKAVFWCFVCNLALMFPVGAVLFTVQHLLGCLEGGSDPMEGFWTYMGFALAVLLLLFVLHWFQYASLYIATYRESANRRVSLAETLRRLPLSFFGNRDLSDLTSTMIADCSSLDQMFSHYVPQLFASIGSTLVIGVCMFACDWRMALAVLWVVPVAVALTAGSKKIQDAFGTKNILNKRAVADCIQEGLETIRDIKACHRQERYLGDLEAKLSAMEGSSIRSELATGVFVCSAQAFLRLGLATTVLTGGALLLAGELSFLYFLGFLFAAARLYDPLGVVLQNIAATFNTKLQIERMRSILEQPVQTGTEDFHPDRYDITFDHVSFAYREGAGGTGGCELHRPPGGGHRPDRPLRRRKIHRLQAGCPVLGCHRREGVPGWDGRVHGGPGDPPALLLHGVPGRGAVPGYGDGEHPSGPQGRHR